MREVYILEGCRTAIGNFGGMYMNLRALDLGVTVAKEALRRAQVPGEALDDVLVGCCMMVSDEINIGRCISLKAGVPFQVPAATIQRQCSSSMQALVFAAQQIQTGESDLVLVGGVESMTHTPYVLKGARFGYRLQHGELTDALWEGLTDPVHKIIMGLTAENLAAKHGISRAAQDELALTSHQRAAAAIQSGRFKEEIVPVEVPGKRGKTTVIDTDEHVRLDLTLEELAGLRPAFKKDGGTVTAGNSSGLNDGAAAVVVASGEKVRELNLKPMGRLVAHAAAGVEPELMGYGPVPATQKALKRAGWKLSDVELIECNEAFAAQYLSCEKLLGLDRAITNVNGSGIALGHPVGCTGVRLVISLLHELRRRSLKRGLATLCVGGGMGKSVLVERV
ncbi:MAG TPA: thiolase family protein [Myxococcota bacterium]|nr:thiolase family protein [Myxococcota bacterium]HRY96850.1 thiolase family protein [Myxococcota bacterium]